MFNSVAQLDIFVRWEVIYHSCEIQHLIGREPIQTVLNLINEVFFLFLWVFFFFFFFFLVTGSFISIQKESTITV